MVERLIVRERLPRLDRRLGRNVNHDSASRAYRVGPPEVVELHAVRHESRIAILDQLKLGSCTGNAGTAAIYREPFMTAQAAPWLYPPTEAGAVALYSAATRLDPYQGDYPPEDTGSDGLSVAKVLKARGIISGYLWAFTIEEAVAQLMSTPLITGVPWLQSMFTTNAGRVVVDKGSVVAGGHELCVDEYRPAVGNVPALVAGPNSWGTSWGDGGRWCWTVDEWAWLLAQQGDVTAFVPNTEPAPGPVGPADPGDVLWKATRSWSGAPHTGGNAKAASAVRAWAKTTGRS